MPKKLNSSLYGDSLLLNVLDHLQATDRPLTVGEIFTALDPDRSDKQNSIYRIRRCLRALLDNKKVILIEQKSKYKTTLHLYQWIRQ